MAGCGLRCGAGKADTPAGSSSGRRQEEAHKAPRLPEVEEVHESPHLPEVKEVREAPRQLEREEEAHERLLQPE